MMQPFINPTIEIKMVDIKNVRTIAPFSKSEEKKKESIEKLLNQGIPEEAIIDAHWLKEARISTEKNLMGPLICMINAYAVEDEIEFVDGLASFDMPPLQLLQETVIEEQLYSTLIEYIEQNPGCTVTLFKKPIGPVHETDNEAQFGEWMGHGKGLNYKPK